MTCSNKSVCLIVCNENVLKKDFIDKDVSFLVNRFNKINFNINKVVIVSENSTQLAKELKNVFKDYEVILVKSNLANGIAYKALEIIFKEKLHINNDLLEIFKEKKIKYSCKEIQTINLNVLRGDQYPVPHILGFFFIHENYAQNIYCNILESYFLEYSNASIFRKKAVVQLNGNITSLQEIKVEQISIEIKTKKNNITEVYYMSPNLSNLLAFENKLNKTVHILSSQVILGDLVYQDKNKKIKHAIQIIEDCFMKYSPENVFISFNGGKDCTVLLHLMLVVLEKKYPSYTNQPICLYVQSECPFPEQDNFIKSCQQLFNLEIICIKSNIKEALHIILSKKPNLKACLMGTRRTDPFSIDLGYFQMTDKEYPEVMRVNPLLDWHYFQIWDYLLYYKIPYCPLYDLGYTSLGNIDNTIKNPHLLNSDFVENKQSYLPAYKLMWEEKERSGRS